MSIEQELINRSDGKCELCNSAAGLTEKRGTAVRNISLVYDNAEQIEGKVNGQQIVILTQYVKKN